MIHNLSIRNFKRFGSAEIPLRRMSVLTGLNGAGKSTAIQALLLARQATASPETTVVRLNGPNGLALGEAHDVLYHGAEEQEIEVGVHSDAGEHEFRFEVPDERALHLPVRSRPGSDAPELAGRGFDFTYLMAERLGPRDQLSVDSEERAGVGVGEQGEYTAQALALYETSPVREALRHPETMDHGVTTLRSQVELWASEIIRPVRITAQWAEGITASTIRFQNPGVLSEAIRPNNMGFGVSYALPIVVAGLLAPSDGVLIVENPEAHLHPAGQSRLGRFLAQVAGSGTQIIIETHSDHVLNGIRLACAEEGVLLPAGAVVHFFGTGEDSSPTTIDVTGTGALTSWPEGFFDQIEEDLGRLARAKRRNRR